MAKTKIVATLGPASENPLTITQMINAGLDVIRLNTKHNDLNWHREQINVIRKIAQNSGKPLGILVDLQGPEIRVETPAEKPLNIKANAHVVLSGSFIPDQLSIRIDSPNLIAQLEPGQDVLIDDGYLAFKVDQVSPTQATLVAQDDYIIKHRKGINFPGLDIDVSPLNHRDYDILDMLKDHPPEFVALSFVRRATDIHLLREELKRRKIETEIIAKIEGKHAIENLDEIIEAADGFMVARGDLGIELPIEEITYWQKLIIRKCRHAAKPVITATEMLQSMIENPRPTRAEVSDVANAVYDGTDAIMLSGETAVGKHPVKAVAMMDRISRFNEEKNFVPKLDAKKIETQTRVIAHAVIDILQQNKDFNLDAAIVFTESGRTARIISRFRPLLPIIAITENTQVRNQLALSYGVDAYRMDLPEGEILEIDSVIELLKSEGIARSGTRIIFVHGDRWKIPGLTNTITIKEIP